MKTLTNGSPAQALLFVLFCAAMTGASDAWARHEPTELSASNSLEPRLYARTQTIDVSAVLHGHNLIIYLDNTGDDTLLAGAEVDVSFDGATVRAREEAQGIYHAPADPLQRPGRHELTFEVQTPEFGEVISASLDVPRRSPHSWARRPGLEASVLWPGAALTAFGAVSFGLGVLTTLLIQRRRHARTAYAHG